MNKSLAVLLIEDDFRDGNLAHDMLASAGLVYDRVKTVPQAIGALRTTAYDLIVTTTWSSDGRLIGPEAVQKARELDQHPVIVALGNRDDELQWNGIHYDYYADKFANGVFYTGYAFQRILEEQFGE